jgi:pimeloyl-ACP methyl ester carboxylesterase
MPYAVNDGVHIHYEVEGIGPPIVFLHGLFGSLEIWRVFKYVEALRNDYKLILVDARGHGRSDKPHDPEAYKTEKMVGDVVAVLGDLAIGKAHFHGYSMGGQVGWCIGRYAPDRFQSLIIGGSPPYEYDPKIPNPNNDLYVPMLRKGNEGYVSYLEASGREVLPAMRRIYMGNDPEALIARLLRVERVGYEETIATTKLPCLLYMGDADPGYSKARRCVGALPRARRRPEGC